LYFCGKLREYAVEKDTFLHLTSLADINEGGNPMLHLDTNKIVLLNFDLDNDFKSHEVIAAKLHMEVGESFRDGIYEFCFLKEPDFY